MLVEVDATDTEPLELMLYHSGPSENYNTGHYPRCDEPAVYYTPYTDESSYSGDVTEWTPCGNVAEDGTFTLDIAELELTSGRYLFAIAGQYGAEYTDAIVSAPGGIIVDVARTPRTVTFKNEFADDTTQTVEDGQTVTKPTDPEKDGYRFIGWCTDEARTTAYNFSSKVTANITLYAKWVRLWTVTFDNNGTTTTVTVDDNTTVNEPKEPARDGYRFDGWFTDSSDTAYVFTTPVTADVTLHAKWTKIWTVTFVNGGETSTETADDNAAVAAPEEPVRAGYVFLGWFAEGSENAYDFTAPVTDDLTLTAKWVRLWTVTFVDGLGTDSVQLVRDGALVQIPEAPEHDGYTFLGWFTDENCTEKYSFAAPVTADLTLYAGWEKDTPIIPVLPAIIGKPSSPSTGSGLWFTDVSRSDWSYEGVKYVWEEGLMNGTGSRTFSPEANTTRGMILTMLARAEGVNTSGTPWYAAGQKWAMDAEISDGTNMEGAITREQLAAMLYRYAKRKGYDVSRSAELSGYTDAASVSTYAVDAMRWAVAEGLIQGMGGKLNPQATATRAQVATILMRFMKLYTK